MLKELAKIKYYVAALLASLGVFMWTGFTGTCLLGDDNESVESQNGYYSNSTHSRGGHGARFYHK